MRTGTFDNVTDINQNQDAEQHDNVYPIRPSKRWSYLKITYAISALSFAFALGSLADEYSGRHKFNQLETSLRQEATNFRNLQAESAANKRLQDADWFKNAAKLKDSEADRVTELGEVCHDSSFKKFSCPNLWNGLHSQNISSPEALVK